METASSHDRTSKDLSSHESCGRPRIPAVFPGVERRHAIGELVLVHVFVAGCAAKLIEMVRYYLCTGHWLVAFIAGHRQMAACKWES